MRRDVVALIVGWTLVALCIPLTLALLVTIFLDDWSLAIRAFLPSLVISGLTGFLLIRGWVRSDTEERLRDREAFAAVAMCWPAVVAIGALPFWLSGVFIGPFTEDAQFVDILRGGVNSWFESMSGFTTTGATVIGDTMSPACKYAVVDDCINSQPKGLLLWRFLRAADRAPATRPSPRLQRPRRRRAGGEPRRRRGPPAAPGRRRGRARRPAGGV